MRGWLIRWGRLTLARVSPPGWLSWEVCKSLRRWLTVHEGGGSYIFKFCPKIGGGAAYTSEYGKFFFSQQIDSFLAEIIENELRLFVENLLGPRRRNQPIAQALQEHGNAYFRVERVHARRHARQQKLIADRRWTWWGLGALGIVCVILGILLWVRRWTLLCRPHSTPNKLRLMW